MCENCERLQGEIAKLRAERLMLDRRIHNQRVANRETWEIVEQRRKWLGSDTARKHATNYAKALREAMSELAQLKYGNKTGT